jgi:hypothetical protein
VSRETLLGGMGAWADAEAPRSDLGLMGAAEDDVGTGYQISDCMMACTI